MRGRARLTGGVADLPVPPRHHPPVRASDAERDAAVARLREASREGRLDLDEFGERVAAVYGAATTDDLDRLTADLPVSRPAVAARRPTRWTVGLFSAERRTGPWHPAQPTRAWATLGSCEIDLADVECDRPEIEVRAIAVLGGIDVVVPDGARVELDGFAVFGSKRCRLRAAPARDDLPIVRVRARAVFGSVAVRNRRRPVP